MRTPPFRLHFNNGCAKMNILFLARRIYKDTVVHISLRGVLRLDLQGSKLTGLMMELKIFKH